MTASKTTPAVRCLHRLLRNQRTQGLQDHRLLERFLCANDENAFAMLVKRHGPLVLGVCRRVLHNEHDAQDAFQATFLVLARRARSIRKHGSVASWLHGVARRVAHKAQSRDASRHRREQHAARQRVDVSPGLDEMTWRELRGVLDAELGRLPENLRAPLVLCYFEGLTRDEAARQLHLSPRTLKARLECARERLRRRLTRRGLTLPAALLTAMLAQTSASAMPAGLIPLTVQAAIGSVAVRQAVTALVLAVLRESLLAKIKLTVATLCLLAAIGTGMVACHSPPANADAAPATPPPARQARKQPAAEPAPARPRTIDNATVARTDDGIVRGLEWIVRQQINSAPGSAAAARTRPSHWSFPGSKYDAAATALALLPLLEAGHTHKTRDALHPYLRNVEGGLNYLLRVQQADGRFAESMYSHALATMALCEAYRRTTDPALKVPAQHALDFIVNAQHGGGGWRYAPNQPGDTSVTSWHILALSYGKRAGLNVPAEVLKRADSFLDQVVSADGTGYGYTPGAAATPAMTAAGFMCRLELATAPKDLDGWAGKVRQTPPGPGCFFQFFATRTLHKRGGADWEAWSAALRKQLLQKQDSDGSWSADGDPFGPAVGRLLITALAVHNLQSCARGDPPLTLPSRTLKSDELAPLYAALGSDDFVKARHALQRLLAAPGQTVPFLAKTLGPAKAAAPEKIDRLIADLNTDDFAVRQKASAELEKLGDQTHAALRRALAGNPTLEARRRIERVMEATADEDAKPERRQVLRALDILAQLGTHQAREVLRSVATGPPHARVTEAAKEALKRVEKTGQP